ncbi:hypothetical protein ACFFKU_02635 [Kineococcus gynurae]|uniref:DUF2530 domain-containing protein n=1 Tax=Kineococcus gynurae TaxID=452979 RepID=A0ABV5LSJ2_9ACTN
MNPDQNPVAVGTLVGGLVWLAVAVALGLHELTGRSLDWRWGAAAVLLLAGLLVLVGTAVAGLRRRR